MFFFQGADHLQMASEYFTDDPAFSQSVFLSDNAAPSQSLLDCSFQSMLYQETCNDPLLNGIQATGESQPFSGTNANLNTSLTQFQQSLQVPERAWNAGAASPVDLSTCSVPFNQVLLQNRNPLSPQQLQNQQPPQDTSQRSNVIRPVFVVTVPQQQVTIPQAPTFVMSSHPKRTTLLPIPTNQPINSKVAISASPNVWTTTGLPVLSMPAPLTVPVGKPRKRTRTPTAGVDRGGVGGRGRSNKIALSKNTFSCRRCRKHFAVNRILMHSSGSYEQMLPQFCITCSDATGGTQVLVPP